MHLLIHTRNFSSFLFSLIETLKQILKKEKRKKTEKNLSQRFYSSDRIQQSEREYLKRKNYGVSTAHNMTANERQHSSFHEMKMLRTSVLQ